MTETFLIRLWHKQGCYFFSVSYTWSVAYNHITLGPAASHVLYYFLRFCLVMWFSQSLKLFISFFFSCDQMFVRRAVEICSPLAICFCVKASMMSPSSQTVINFLFIAYWRRATANPIRDITVWVTASTAHCIGVWTLGCFLFALDISRNNKCDIFNITELVSLLLVVHQSTF